MPTQLAAELAARLHRNREIQTAAQSMCTWQAHKKIECLAAVGRINAGAVVDLFNELVGAIAICQDPLGYINANRYRVAAAGNTASPVPKK